MVTTFGRMRALVLIAAVLFAGLSAAFASPAQEASAVSPCRVSAAVYRGVSNGSYYVYGHGTSDCSNPISVSSPPHQWIYVQLYKNGTLIDSHGWFASEMKTWAISGSTHSHWCSPGALYKTVVTHDLGGQRSQHVYSSYAC